MTPAPIPPATSSRLLLLFALLMVVGCQEAPPQKSILKSLNAPTDAEAEAFGEKMAKAVTDEDSATVDSMINLQAMVDTALVDLDLKGKKREEFVKGFRKGLNQRGGFGNEIVSNVSSGGSYEFLRVHEVDGQKRALCRLVVDTQGINYHDFVLHKDEAGNVKAVDIHVAMTSELMSETFRRVLIPAVAQLNRGVMDRLAGKEEDLVKHMDDVQRMNQAMNTDPQITLNIFKTLPKSLQKDKTLLLVRLQAAAKTSPEEYAAAFEAFRAEHPKDPALLLMSIDYYLLQEEWEKALEAVDQVDESLGGDPYLDVLRVTIYGAKGDTKKAMQLQAKAIAAGYLPAQ